MSNEAFAGKIGRTREESIPAWQEQKRAKPGAPRRAPVFWELYERHGSYRYTGKIKDAWIHPGERAVA